MPVPQAATIGTIWIRFESLQARRLSGRQARHMVGRAWGRKRQEQRQRRKQGGHGQLGSAYLHTLGWSHWIVRPLSYYGSLKAFHVRFSTTITTSGVLVIRTVRKTRSGSQYTWYT
jgi:hypothetical protein